MSRVGKKPIPIPDGVSVDIADNAVVKVKGPKGELSTPIPPLIKVGIDEGLVHVSEMSWTKKKHSSWEDCFYKRTG